MLVISCLVDRIVRVAWNLNWFAREPRREKVLEEASVIAIMRKKRERRRRRRDLGEVRLSSLDRWMGCECECYLEG